MAKKIVSLAAAAAAVFLGAASASAASAWGEEMDPDSFLWSRFNARERPPAAGAASSSAVRAAPAKPPSTRPPAPPPPPRPAPPAAILPAPEPEQTQPLGPSAWNFAIERLSGPETTAAWRQAIRDAARRLMESREYKTYAESPTPPSFIASFSWHKRKLFYCLKHALKISSHPVISRADGNEALALILEADRHLLCLLPHHFERISRAAAPAVSGVAFVAPKPRH